MPHAWKHVEALHACLGDVAQPLNRLHARVGLEASGSSGSPPMQGRARAVGATARPLPSGVAGCPHGWGCCLPPSLECSGLPAACLLPPSEEALLNLYRALKTLACMSRIKAPLEASGSSGAPTHAGSKGKSAKCRETFSSVNLALRLNMRPHSTLADCPFNDVEFARAPQSGGT